MGRIALKTECSNQTPKYFLSCHTTWHMAMVLHYVHVYKRYNGGQLLFKIKIHQKHNYLHLSHTKNLLQSGYMYRYTSTSQVSSLSSNTLILGTTDTRVHGRLESNIVLVDVAI